MLDPTNVDVTSQFIVKTTDGALNIAKRDIIFTSKSDTKEYDGTPLTNDTVTVGGDGFAANEGDYVEFNVTGSQTLVGFSPNTFDYVLNEGILADNYNINKIEGQLNVTNRDVDYKIYLEAEDGEFKYDGTEKTVEGFKTLTVGEDTNNNNLPEEDEPQVKKDVSGLDTLTFEWQGKTYTLTGLTAAGKGTDADEYSGNISGTAVIVDEDGNDVSSEFAVIAKEGILSINKREVTLTSATAMKQFDGEPLTAPEVEVTGDGFAAGEGAVYDVIGTQTYVGESSNTFYYYLNEGTKLSNYNITVEYGKLTVIDRDAAYPITVTANSDEFKYDGTEKSVSGFETLTFVIEGNTYTVEGLTAEVKATDAGEYISEVVGTPVVLDENGQDVTAQFNVTTVNGTLEITKRNVVITSGSDSKEYDGKPLTNSKITVSGDGFAENEGAEYDITGSQTEVGKSDNEFTYTLNENTKESNYVIETVFGELEVTKSTSKPDPEHPDPVIPPIPAEGDAVLVKVDSEDNTTTLSGAKFELYRVGLYSDEYIDWFVTDKNGLIEVEDLRPGSYYWVEIGAPEGYMLDNGEHHLFISSNQTTVVTVKNEKTEVPEEFGLDHYAYVIGYPDGGVHPESNITRAEVATIFFRLLSDEVRNRVMTDENSFSDVEDGMWFNRAVSTMANMGIVNGYPDGTFRPNEYITRAEFAAIAARFEDNGDTTPANFSDIYGHWGMEEISIAANNGWILGYTDNTFKPDQDITRAEAMTLVNRILQRIVEHEDDLHDDMITWFDNMDTEKWYYLAVQEATNSHYYYRKPNYFEVWTDIRPVRDWTELEK